MLFSEPKIPQFCRFEENGREDKVSVLFSEPKIPQWNIRTILNAIIRGFSALQRAENSSICSGVCRATMINEVSVLFSEPKIPQLLIRSCDPSARYRFSALQRAENSSI